MIFDAELAVGAFDTVVNVVFSPVFVPIILVPPTWKLYNVFCVNPDIADETGVIDDPVNGLGVPAIFKLL